MWEKLKHEWKTAAWAVVTFGAEASWYIDPTLLDPLIDPKYHGLVHMVVPLGFLVLRQWKAAHDA